MADYSERYPNTRKSKIAATTGTVLMFLFWFSLLLLLLSLIPGFMGLHEYQEIYTDIPDMKKIDNVFDFGNFCSNRMQASNLPSSLVLKGKIYYGMFTGSAAICILLLLTIIFLGMFIFDLRDYILNETNVNVKKLSAVSIALGIFTFYTLNKRIPYIPGAKMKRKEKVRHYNTRQIYKDGTSFANFKGGIGNNIPEKVNNQNTKNSHNNDLNESSNFNEPLKKQVETDNHNESGSIPQVIVQQQPNNTKEFNNSQQTNNNFYQPNIGSNQPNISQQTNNNWQQPIISNMIDNYQQAKNNYQQAYNYYQQQVNNYRSQHPVNYYQQPFNNPQQSNNNYNQPNNSQEFNNNWQQPINNSQQFNNNCNQPNNSYMINNCQQSINNCQQPNNNFSQQPNDFPFNYECQDTNNNWLNDIAANFKNIVDNVQSNNFNKLQLINDINNLDNNIDDTEIDNLFDSEKHQDSKNN